jgi:hypothetical protein
MTDVLNPPPSLLAKVGSIVAHVQEGSGEDGHPFDWEAARALIRDPDVQAWLKGMRKIMLIPEPRQPDPSP